MIQKIKLYEEKQEKQNLEQKKYQEIMSKFKGKMNKNKMIIFFIAIV
jgi:hypothetical protein